MNAASEMSIWLIFSTIFLVQLQFAWTNSFSTAYRHSESGRKLFGGYRIVPRPCKGTATTGKQSGQQKNGICMFNYECNQRKGEMIGSCIDGFLFGVCCSVPQSIANVELENDDVDPLDSYVNILSSLTLPSPSTSSSLKPSSSYASHISNKRPSVSNSTQESTSSYGKPPPSRRPILEQYFSNQTNGGFIDNQGFLPTHAYPDADTILLNPDGTVVEDDKNPEKIFTTQQQPTTPSQSQSQSNYVYGVDNEYYNANRYTPPKIESVTKNAIESTVSSIQKLTTKLSAEKYPSRPGSQSQGGTYTYLTQSSSSSSSHFNGPTGSHVTFVKYPTPSSMYTTSSSFNKKTDMLPLPSSTSKPPYIIADDNMILMQTFTNHNKVKNPTTRLPTEATQVVSKASLKPIKATTKIPFTTTTTTTTKTTATQDMNDHYSNYNYHFYTGSSKPPILITHPVGLDDNGQAISHILGILNSTNPRPETITESITTDGGLSTWVSIVGDEKPTKNKYPKPGTVKPGTMRPATARPGIILQGTSRPGVEKPPPMKRPSSTATTHVHGPSYTITSNENKPAPTVVVITQDSSLLHATKPTRRPVTGIYSHTTNKLTVTNTNVEAESVKPGQPTQSDEIVFHTSQENLINFPPVRNPDLNATGLNQMEKPTVVQTFTGQGDIVHLANGITLDVLPDASDPLNAIDTDDEDYDDITTPTLQEDKIDSQVYMFVEKIVNSLSGNFQDLEQVLFKNENKTSITNGNGIQLNNIQIGEDGERYTTTENFFTTMLPTRKPSRKPTTVKPEYYETTIVETTVATPQKKPKPTTRKPVTPTYSSSTSSGTIIKGTTASSLTVTEPVRKPSTGSIFPTRKPTTSAPVKRPTAVVTTGASTKKPTTAASTKKPTPAIITATKRPAVITTVATTTKKPVVTKRPRPTTTSKRTTTTTTTTTTTAAEVTDFAPENDEEVTEALDSSTQQPPVDFRRECGVRPLVKKGGRIVGGKGSQFGYYPWQVLVRESTWLGLFTKNKCGGVLITNRYVITAAHCQPGFLASLVAVFGEYDISGELESKRSVAKNVRRVIVHRQYDPATFENDLALLELDSPVAYDTHIVPICMPKEGEDYVGRMATVTGWGRLKYGGGVPSVLQEVRVPLIENSVCQEMFQTAGHQKRIINSFLCAGYANGQKDSCEGDSGGPLMVERDDGRWVLLGTVSHGIKCAAPYLPGVYMRTTYYKPWLKSITGVST